MEIDALAPGLPLDLALARNVMVVNIPAYELGTIEERNRIDYFLEVYVPEFPGSNEYIRLETLEAKEAPKVTDGAVETYNGAFFEIDDLLRSFLKATPPDHAQSGIKALPYSVTPYYCHVVIKVDGETDHEEDLPPAKAIFAGISENDYTDYHDVFFTQFIGPERRFLTYKPATSALAPDQPELLYWLHNYTDTISELHLKVVATTQAGTEIEGIALSLSSVQAFRVYSIPVGIAILSTVHAAAAKIKSYTVWLVDENGDRVSEVRTYLPDTIYRRQSRYLYFLNSLGVYECLRLTGTGSEDLEMLTATAAQFTGYSYLARMAEQVTTDKRAARMLTVNLQWSLKSVVKYLTDFALSWEYYFYGDREILPLRLLSKGFSPLNDEEDFAGRQFNFEFTNTQRYYSDLPLVGEKPTRATRWVPLAAACELDSRGRYTGTKKITMLELVYQDDGSQVIPRVIKPNVPNEAGYVPPSLSTDCELADTPFLSAAISAQGTFVKNNCGAGTVGTTALITVAADAWGSTISQEDADAKAQAEWNSLNTQAYANANGSCSAPVTAGLRSKFWNYEGGIAGYGPNFNFSSAPTFTDTRANANLDGAGNVQLNTQYPAASAGGIANDYWVSEWNGYIKAAATATDLRLDIRSAEGVQVWIDDVLVLDDWRYGSGVSTERVTSALAVTVNELYKVRLRFYHSVGYCEHFVRWKWTGQAVVNIPNANLLYI